MIDFDARLGQLAIARGLISLGDLLRCVEESGRTGKDVGDLLLVNGHLSNAQIVELEQRLASSDEHLQAELERGHTIVLDELYQSVVDESVPAAMDTGDDDAATTLEFEVADLELGYEDRYELKEEIGRGGMGRVHLAKDLILQRSVALKTLLDDAKTAKGRERLLIEAQVTGLLEHPSIVPVYDLRAMRSGEPFYTMRFVQEKSLEELLSEIRKGEVSHSLTLLVSILRQVSLAIQFAHDIGVVHRDLKPENILVGKYGEVYVIDWGVAKIVSADIELESTGKVVMGQLVGTPAYMAPEQARGDNDMVNELSDVYALGAILYEILTLEPMFTGDHVLSVLFQVVHDMPERPAERAPDRKIPSELEDVCMRALAKEPTRRYLSAQEFADELDLFLEGVKERERRRQMAEQALEEAAQFRAVYEEIRAQHAKTLDALEQERVRIESWAPPEDKESLWDLQQAAEDLQVEIEKRFGETIRMYGQALVHLPAMPEARAALANMYWERFEEAERAQNPANAAYFEGLVRQYNDGAYDSLLEGTASLSLTTQPPGAEATLYRYQEVRRRLVEWRVADLDETPIEHVEISHGSHVIELTCEGYRSMLVPLSPRRGDEVSRRVTLRTEDEVPNGFVVVPGGEFLSGRIESARTQARHVADFAIMKHPVTVAEYLDFLNAHVPTDPEFARRHAPRVKHDGEPYLPADEDGFYYLPETDPEGDVWDPAWPIIMVNYDDAEAYAQWRSSRDDRTFRLPTFDEWQKAARGVDGRVYPWGNHFDAAFCLMRESRRGRSTPAPVGTFPIDRSPYGMLDAAGNVAEWTSTQEEGSDGVMLLGGAAFNSVALACRLDFTLTSPRQFTFVHYGFRLVLPLSSEHAG